MPHWPQGKVKGRSRGRWEANPRAKGVGISDRVACRTVRGG